MRRHSSVVVNDVDDKYNLRTSIIFNDIKFVTNNSDIYSHDMLQKGASENAFTNYMRNNVKQGDTIVHVSNGIGVNLLLMAKLVGQAGRIYAYNPYEKYTSAIQKSAESNGFESRVKIKTYAISDSSFDGVLVYKNNFPILSGELQPATYIIPAGYSSMDVKVKSLDELLPNLQNINYLTIDNEKCEKILSGAKKLISRSKDISIVLNSPNIADWEFFCDFIKEFDFEIFEIQDKGNLVRTNIEDLKKDSSKYLLLKQK